MPQDPGPHHGDLAWARELAAGDRGAIARYEREIAPVIEAQLRRRGLADDAIADVQQTLRARLLVGDGDGPAIARYEGRAGLLGWVMVGALREAARVRQRASREPSTEDDALIELAAGVESHAGEIDKQRYREAFRVAFRAALTALAPRDRVLLRMHLIDGLTIDQIGVVQGVHRATAARWLERAREAVSRHVRQALMRQLGADPFETDEIMRWVQSRIELSLSMLGGRPDAGPRASGSNA